MAAHGTADAQSESIGPRDSASEDDGDANEHEHDLEDGYEPIYESEDGFEQMMQDNADPAGVPWPGIPDEWSDDDSGESDAESGEFGYDDSDGDMSGFDEDAMHFEIEGTTQGADRVRDPEERGHYLLHDGRVPSSHTGMNHQQGSDSVCAAGDGLLLVTGDVDVRLVDANAIVSDGAYDADGKFNEPDPDGPGPVRKSPDGPDGAEYVASTPSTRATGAAVQRLLGGLRRSLPTRGGLRRRSKVRAGRQPRGVSRRAPPNERTRTRPVSVVRARRREGRRRDGPVRARHGQLRPLPVNASKHPTVFISMTFTASG